MPARRILQLGDPILRSISVSVAPERTASVIQDLDDTLAEFRRTHGFGRGISAIQIGEAIRLIYLEVEGRKYELINPEYTYKSEKLFTLYDDCFSFPHLMVRLERHAAVRVRHQDRSGNWNELSAEGAMAELVQHEMDHLDGILAVDHARSPLDLMTREEFLRQNHRPPSDEH